jgi:hypothetical protein
MFQRDHGFGLRKWWVWLAWLLGVAFVYAILALNQGLDHLHPIGKIVISVFVVVAIILRKKIGNWWD